MARNVLLVRNAYSHDFGGAERYSIYLSSELNKNEYSSVVASRHPQVLELAQNNDISTIKMPWLNAQDFSGWRVVLFPFFIIWIAYVTLWYMFAIVRKDIHILHLQSRDDFIAGTIAGKLLKKQVLWTDHADLKYIFINTNKPLKNPIGKLVLHLAKSVDAIIIVSHNELKLIENIVGTTHNIRFSVVHNGLTDRLVKPLRIGAKTDAVFVSTSRLVYSKGLKELIVASQKLQAEGLNTKTILLGVGPDSSELQAIAPDNVLFLGYPDNALSIVAGSDVFVHPSYNEGFSISLIEAAMLSRPTIATNVGGNPEIIQDKVSGILIPPKDSQCLYDAMKYAVENPAKMTTYGKSLREKYEKDFQFDRIVRMKIIPLYEGII